MLPKVSGGANQKKKENGWGDLVRIIILIWSAGLLTASYVRLPGGNKMMDFDPTFIASVFSGSLAGFGVAVASKNGMNVAASNGGNGNALPETPVYSRPKEEEKYEPEVRSIWNEPTSEPPLEDEVEDESDDVDPPQNDDSLVRPRRGDL